VASELIGARIWPGQARLGSVVAVSELFAPCRGTIHAMPKMFAAAAERNAEPILAVLKEALPEAGLVLEIASGSGQHAAHFAAALPSTSFQPSDCRPEALASISAYQQESGLANLHPPLWLDVLQPAWPIHRAQAVVCINMIHIAPFAACRALFRGAARLLGRGSSVVLYGPYVIDGDFRAQSNIDFDRALRSQNPEWGIRELRDVERVASEHGFALERLVPRPANNHVLLFRHSPVSLHP
jgi:hypothetical protein